MGGCASTSNQSTCSSTSNAGASSCLCTRLRRRKRNKRTFADHVINMQQLSSIPNRIFANGKSQSSCIFTQQGRKGINQDAMIVWEDFMTEDMTFCGVFDGHGPHGHLVARKVRDSLPVKLLSFLNQTKLVGSGGGTGDENGLGNVVDLNADDGVMEGKKDEEGSSEISNKRDELWKEAFLKSYKAMDKELKSHPNLDCFCSGSTAVTIIKQGSDLFMGSIGDSRAIMGTKSGDDDSLVAVQLTVDLKPDLPREAERIKQCKGRVFALQDEPEVPRVWLPFVDAPGLAMARAFGDFCLKEYGVICVPEFSHRTLSDKDQFIVLASDGVWDVLSNEEVVEVVSSAPTRSSAARLLVESAAREWKLKYPTSKMDDCAVVCLFLDGKMDSDPSDYEDHGGFSSATIQSTHSGGAAASELDNEQNPAESDQLESESEPTLLERNNTVRTTEENGSFSRFAVEAAAFAKEQEDNVAVEVEVEEEQKWSSLEGVTRVNSIVQLPRFSSETAKKTSSGS